LHIPDGYLSPESCTVLGAAMVPVWVTAGRRVKKIVRNRYVPLLAIGAALRIPRDDVSMSRSPTAQLRTRSARG